MVVKIGGNAQICDGMRALPFEALGAPEVGRFWQ